MHRPHLLEAWGQRFNLQIDDPDLTLFRYSDVPGMVGRVGTCLGEHGININAAAVGREDGEGSSDLAVMAVTTDGRCRTTSSTRSPVRRLRQRPLDHAVGRARPPLGPGAAAAPHDRPTRRPRHLARLARGRPDRARGGDQLVPRQPPSRAASSRAENPSAEVNPLSDISRPRHSSVGPAVPARLESMRLFAVPKPSTRASGAVAQRRKCCVARRLGDARRAPRTRPAPSDAPRLGRPSPAAASPATRAPARPSAPAAPSPRSRRWRRSASRAAGSGAQQRHGRAGPVQRASPSQQHRAQHSESPPWDSTGGDLMATSAESNRPAWT